MAKQTVHTHNLLIMTLQTYLNSTDVEIQFTVKKKKQTTKKKTYESKTV